MENEERPKRDLRERTFTFARQVIKVFVALDRIVLVQTLGRQLLRAGTSVGANDREADQARNKPEFVAKIGDCLKEADETAYWLELMAAEGVGTPKVVASALGEAGQLVAIFTTIKRRAEGKE
jgi:four helix bundle protein